MSDHLRPIETSFIAAADAASRLRARGQRIQPREERHQRRRDKEQPEAVLYGPLLEEELDTGAYDDHGRRGNHPDPPEEPPSHSSHVDRLV